MDWNLREAPSPFRSHIGSLQRTLIYITSSYRNEIEAFVNKKLNNDSSYSFKYTENSCV